MLELTIPGKLFLAGEYAVTRAGSQALLAAVFPGVTSQITASQTIAVTSNIIAGTWPADDHADWRFVAAAVRLMQDYTTLHNAPTPPFSLTLTTKLAPNGDKLGYGSSSAVVVAVVKSLAQFWQLELDLLTQFKLAAVAHLYVQQNGSLGDVASSTFGGLIAYTKPDFAVPVELDARLVDQDWPHLAIQPIAWPANWDLLVFETHEQANTKKHQARHYQADFEADFWTESDAIVANLITAFQTQDYDAVTTELAFNQALLAGQLPDDYITDKLADVLDLLMDMEAAGKISGSGFGDNAFAIVESGEELPTLPGILTRRTALAPAQ